MPGFDKLLRGALTFRKDVRPGFLKQIQHATTHPEPKAVMVSCVDARILTSQLLQSSVGDMFVSRNAGNFVPDYRQMAAGTPNNEAAVLQMGCISNNIDRVIVCGHADCKAVTGLHGLRHSMDAPSTNPIHTWLQHHGAPTVAKFTELEKSSFQKPVSFQGAAPDSQFHAYIDPENKFGDVDKLSQLNTLQQLQHVASYPFLQPKFASGDLHLHALWFNLHEGSILMYCRSEQRYIEIRDDTFDTIIKEISTS